MENNEFLEPFEQLLADVLPMSAVREVERGASVGDIWSKLDASGFVDALVPESAGGSGLSLSTVGPLWQALGRHAISLPVAETMVARALLAEAGVQRPTQPITLATLVESEEITLQYGLVADHLLIDCGDRLELIEADRSAFRATGAFGDIASTGAPIVGNGVAIASAGHDLRLIGALTQAASIAGAAARLLEMTVSYANERVQFGKPIGRQQALQQNIAVMAEDVVAMRIAVELACAGDWPLNFERVAIAKIMTSKAAANVANTAHAVHGAIGISEEFDLQIFTRKLHAGRLANGSEQYWSKLLGSARLADPRSSIDWVRRVAA